MVRSPIELPKIVSITPLGNLDPSGHVLPTDHIYINVPGSQRQHESTPVVSPGAIEVRRIASQEKLGPDAFTDHRIDFVVCGTFGGHFAHITGIADRLASALSAAGPHCQERTVAGSTFRTCSADLRLALAPGEPVGTTNPLATGLDFGAYDTASRLVFAAPGRYATNALLPNAICPLDLFAPEVRTALYAKLGASDPVRTRSVEPRCGEVMQDRPGTAQGNWFKADRLTYPEDPHLAFVHDNVDPTVPVLSVGTSVPGLSPAAYRFRRATAERTGRDSAEIAPGDAVWCFDGLQGRSPVPGRILLRLPTATTLDVEYQAESGCATTPWTLRAPARFER